MSEAPTSLQEFMQNFRIPWGPIGEQVFRRSYSHRKEDGKLESWPEAVARIVDGNLGLVDKQFVEKDERERLIKMLLPFAALPAGRHLNASGRKGRQYLFNCHASGWDSEKPEDHFTFLFDALMQGGGVGANYSNRYMERLPLFRNTVDVHIVCREDHPNIGEFFERLCPLVKSDADSHEDTFTVPDSREGWVECVERILRAAWRPGETSERRVVIDVSEIRARGEPLKTSGGIACGPGPLVTMLTNLTKTVNSCFERQLTSLDAMTMDHALADCVVAGGKRRSSRMSIKHWADPDILEFIHCKQVDGSHWTTNISVEVDSKFFEAYHDNYHPEHMTARRVMRSVVLGKRTNGEPGIWNIELARKGEREPEKMYCPNPCGEIGLQMWENCNLGHVNMEYYAQKPVAQMMEAFRLMTRWLTRATFGDIPNARQQEVVKRNRRIGVGFFGFHGWLVLNGYKYSDSWKEERVKKVLHNAKITVETEAYRYSQQLGIPVPVKNTTLAPTGSTACLAGTSTSAQTIIDPWYLRRVRYADTDEELALKRLEGYKVYADDDAQNTSIVEYWCEDPLVSKVRSAGLDENLVESQKNISVNNYLEMQAMLQDVYADNGISFTVPLGEHNTPSEEEMEESLMRLLPRLKGTTMYPDKSRKNSPFESLTREQFYSYSGRKEVSQVEDVCKFGCPSV